MKIKAETPFPLDRRTLLAAAPLGILAAACAPAEEAGAAEEEAAAAADQTASADEDAGLTVEEISHRQTARDFVKALETSGLGVVFGQRHGRRRPVHHPRGRRSRGRGR